ncbi:MAG: heat-inducible transcription repressor HrcA [Candidatus Latescibacteria bacterium]|nr:heat-inducible transcription repressor HrcA [Candidatus Latescibacterota bacterium]
MSELSVREKGILRSIVREYVTTAEPVGSRTISKQFHLGISPATIRNSMADLEEKGYIQQPYTSAGRIPTDRGYRCYVDSLMEVEELTTSETAFLEEWISSEHEGDIEAILDQLCRSLADVSKLLGVVLTPRFEAGILQRLDLIVLNQQRVLLVLTIRSGLVKTMLLDLDRVPSSRKLSETVRVLNERLVSLSIGEIQRTIRERVETAPKGDPVLLKTLMDKADDLFRLVSPDDLHVGGTTNISMQPEFSDRRKLADFLDLLEQRERMVSLLNQNLNCKGVSITIGNENPAREMQECSLVTTTYTVGNVSGIVGVVGPTRMPYAKVAPLVSYAASLMSRVLSA